MTVVVVVMMVVDTVKIVSGSDTSFNSSCSSCGINISDSCSSKTITTATAVAWKAVIYKRSIVMRDLRFLVICLSDTGITNTNAGLSYP